MSKRHIVGNHMSWLIVWSEKSKRLCIDSQTVTMVMLGRIETAKTDTSIA